MIDILRNLFKTRNLTTIVETPEARAAGTQETMPNPRQVMAKRLAREKHYQMAERAEWRGNYDQAAVLYDLAEDPRAAGDCFLKLGRRKVAEAMYFKAGINDSMGIEPLPEGARNKFTRLLERERARNPGFGREYDR